MSEENKRLAEVRFRPYISEKLLSFIGLIIRKVQDLRCGSLKGRGVLAEKKVVAFLIEDIGYGDITSTALLDKEFEAHAKITMREEGVVAGLEETAKIFELLGCISEVVEEDGSTVQPGSTIMEVTGPVNSILAGERTALNLLGRMCGIATATASAVSIASRVNPKVRVAGTRKTAPGLRELDKKAVELGGGDTHRLRLDDCVLIKDNHLILGIGVGEAVAKARRSVSFTKKIEVEVESLEDAAEAAEAGADIIMFDNMSPSEIKRCLSELDKRCLRDGRIFEASGGINLENVGKYAATGVDVMSMGCLTHSVRSLNVKLRMESK